MCRMMTVVLAQMGQLGMGSNVRLITPEGGPVMEIGRRLVGLYFILFLFFNFFFNLKKKKLNSNPPPLSPRYLFPDSEYNGLRKIFDPSTDEDCSIFSSSLDGDDDVSCDGGLCMNLYGYQDFESNNLGDGVSVDVRDIGGLFYFYLFFFCQAILKKKIVSHYL